MTNSIHPIALEARNIKKQFTDGQRTLEILKGINLKVLNGEMVTIIGASGSGKSTLMHILGILDTPTDGEVFIGEQATNNLSESNKSKLRNEKLGFVYQFHHLLNEFTALDNVAMPLIVRRKSFEEARREARDVLEKVGLAQRMQHYPAQLSGGERQRVALARALVTKPLCVLADEPTGNLDVTTANQMFELLKEIRQNFKTAFIVVTHDPKLAQLADRCYIMDKGSLDLKE